MPSSNHPHTSALKPSITDLKPLFVDLHMTPEGQSALHGEGCSCGITSFLSPDEMIASQDRK